MNPPGLIDFNVNHYVRVKLTDEGRRILKAGGSLVHKEDIEGWSRWQLWDLMSQFGEHIYCGVRIPFETAIKIETER